MKKNERFVKSLHPEIGIVENYNIFDMDKEGVKKEEKLLCNSHPAIRCLSETIMIWNNPVEINHTLTEKKKIIHVYPGAEIDFSSKDISITEYAPFKKELITKTHDHNYARSHFHSKDCYQLGIMENFGLSHRQMSTNYICIDKHITHLKITDNDLKNNFAPDWNPDTEYITLTKVGKSDWLFNRVKEHILSEWGRNIFESIKHLFDEARSKALKAVFEEIRIVRVLKKDLKNKESFVQFLENNDIVYKYKNDSIKLKNLLSVFLCDSALGLYNDDKNYRHRHAIYPCDLNDFTTDEKYIAFDFTDFVERSKGFKGYKISEIREIFNKGIVIDSKESVYKKAFEFGSLKRRREREDDSFNAEVVYKELQEQNIPINIRGHRLHLHHMIARYFIDKYELSMGNPAFGWFVSESCHNSIHSGEDRCEVGEVFKRTVLAIIDGKNCEEKKNIAISIYDRVIKAVEIEVREKCLKNNAAEVLKKIIEPKINEILSIIQRDTLIGKEKYA